LSSRFNPADAALLRGAVREAGALAMRHYHDRVKSWHKSAGDPVSEADIAIDRLLHERLLGPRPSYGWLSEETADDPIRLQKAKAWIVDPIDGTRAFIQQRPEFCVSVALVDQGDPVLAAIFNPATDQFFFAGAGAGAELNDNPIHVSPHEGLAQARFMGAEKAFEHHRWMAKAPGATFDYRNSIAYRMALVAAGHYEAAVSFGEKSDWDIAAADLLVREAGGCVTSPAGRRFYYNRSHARHADLIAAAPGVHPQLMDLLRSR
jgi:myo-inositol-1(or 4)-monophosphatase